MTSRLEWRVTIEILKWAKCLPLRDHSKNGERRRDYRRALVPPENRPCQSAWVLGQGSLRRYDGTLNVMDPLRR